MKNKLLPIISLVVILLVGCKKDKTEYDVILWYDKPATDWYQALPIGNGTLGAMVYGGIKTEQLQLNENTLYSDEPGQSYLKIDFAKSLNEVKELIKKNDFLKVNEIVRKEWLGRAQPCYQPFGNLFIEFDHPETVSDYKRELDISQAISRTSYFVDNVKFQRETFASFPDQVIVSGCLIAP